MNALQAAMFLVYSDPKLYGKTTLFLRAFPRAVLIGQRSAIQLVAESGCGFSPEPWQYAEGIDTLPKLVWFLSDPKSGIKSPEWTAARKAHGINAVYVDDFSHICQKSMIQWMQENSKDRYYKFNQLDLHLDWVATLLRDLGMLCGISAHKSEIKYDQNEKSPNYGKLIAKGGPEVPSKQQLQSVPGWVDFVAPIGDAPAGVSKDPWWPRVISVDPGETTLWISGDRNRVCWANTPANLREILLAAPTPYDLPRLRGLEWQDEWAQHVCDAVLAGEPVISIVERVFATLKVSPDTPLELHAQWAVQDGIARAAIRAHRALGVLGRLKAASAAAAAPPPPPPAKA